MMRLTYPEAQIFQEKTDITRSYLKIDQDYHNAITANVVSSFLDFNELEALKCEDLADVNIEYIPHNFSYNFV